MTVHPAAGDSGRPRRRVLGPRPRARGRRDADGLALAALLARARPRRHADPLGAPGARQRHGDHPRDGGARRVERRPLRRSRHGASRARPSSSSRRTVFRFCSRVPPRSARRTPAGAAPRKTWPGRPFARSRPLGAPPSSLRAWIGPAIGPCCYEVGGDVAAQFAGEFLRSGCGGGHRLDLKGVNVAQLEDAGVPRAAIRSTRPARSAAARSSRATAATANGGPDDRADRARPQAGVRSA